MPGGDCRGVRWGFLKSLEEEMRMHTKQAGALLQPYTNNKPLASSSATLRPAEPKQGGFSCG